MRRLTIMRRLAFLLVCLLLTARDLRADEVKPDAPTSVVRVNVTNQPWDFARPWGKRPPFSRRAIGTILSENRVLVTAELVANANYVELESAEGGQKVPATVEVVDYEANLALLKTEDTAFLKEYKPLELTHASIGDLLSVWQLESTGTLLVTKGPMTTAEVTRYPIDESPLLVYRMTAPIQFRDSSFTAPGGKGRQTRGPGDALRQHDEQRRDPARAGHRAFPPGREEGAVRRLRPRRHCVVPHSATRSFAPISA